MAEHSPTGRGVLAVAFGVSALLATVPALLPTAGLAAPVVAVGAALGLGVPTALALWNADAPDDDPAWTVVWRSAAVVTAAAAVAPALQLTASAWLGSALLLGLAFALGRAPGWLAGLAVLASLAVSATMFAPAATPWSLLTPRWSTWEDWVPAAVRCGLLAGLVLPGFWSLRRHKGLGATQLPWVAPGVGAWVLVATSLGLGLAYEGGGDAAWLATAVGLPLGLLAVLSLRGLDPDASLARSDALAGTGFLLWFAGPGAAAVSWWWATLLPVLLAASLLRAAWRDVARPLTAGSAAVLLLTAGISFPGVPEELAPATLSALAIVAFIWFAGTRAAVRVP